MAQRDRDRRKRRGQLGPQPQWYWYRSCGLLVRSQLKLPELESAEPKGSTAANTVEICLGDVKPELQEGVRKAPWLQIAPQCSLLEVPHIARYLVENGERITIDRRLLAPKGSVARQRDVRVFLLGTVMAALLHQRQLLPLHVSAVCSSEGAIAFTGPSGAGKSTTAAWLHYRMGIPLLSDDIAILNPADTETLLYPGPPRLKLWDDTIDALSLPRDNLIRDISRADKFHIHHGVAFVPEPKPLRKLIILTRSESGEASVLRRIFGVEAYRAFMGSIYRRELCYLFFNQRKLHDFGGAITSRIEVYEYCRPWHLSEVEPSLQKLQSIL